MGRRVKILICLLVLDFFALLSFNALAATSNFVVYDNNTTFVVQGKSIKASLVPNKYNCWTYASEMYKKIWGDSVKFSSNFTGTASMGHNSLRQLSDADRTLTASHLKSYISNAELGAVVRICGCTSSCSAWSNDGLSCGHKGHNVVIVQKDSNGFTAVENAYPKGQSSYAVCTRYYTWQGFVNWWGGYGCGYIKYIKWPNAPVYNSSSSTKYHTIAYENCTYKIINDVTLRKEPFDSAEKGSYIDADDNVTVTSVAVVDNGTNYWLELGGTYKGQYIFSGYSNTRVQNGNQYLQYVSATHGVTWSGNNLSGITHTQGKILALKGQVTSNATIKSITAQLYHSGSKWGDPYTATVKSKSYSMYGQAIDMNMKFGSLPAGNCRLDLTVEYYTNRMSTATHTIQSSFTVSSGSSTAASTLKITGVKYPSTYMYKNSGYGYVVNSGTVSSNYNLTKITTDIQNSSGSSIATGLPKTVTPSGTSYSISALNSVLPFSKISSAGTYYWIITATDSSGKSVTLKMPINAIASGSNTISTGTTETTAVTGVSVDLDEVTLRAGETTKLTATVSPSNATNKSVTWKSSNTDVASVSNGTVTAVKGGTATITCTTADGGYTASCRVTVTTSVTGISLTPTTLTLEWDNTSTLTPTISPSDASNKTVHWYTSNSSVVSVDNGIIKGVGVGTATITAMAEDGGYTATCEITVITPVIDTPVAEIYLYGLVEEDADYFRLVDTLTVGSWVSVFCSLVDENGEFTTNQGFWCEEIDNEICTVTRDGNIYAKEKGTFELIIHAEENPDIIHKRSIRIHNEIQYSYTADVDEDGVITLTFTGISNEDELISGYVLDSDNRTYNFDLISISLPNCTASLVVAAHETPDAYDYWEYFEVYEESLSPVIDADQTVIFRIRPSRIDTLWNITERFCFTFAPRYQSNFIHKGELMVDFEITFPAKPTPHKHEEFVDAAIAPTCTETGLTEGKHCSVCGEILLAQEVVAALGHTEVIDEALASTCTETGLTEGKHCSVCHEILLAQETVNALGHTLSMAQALCELVEGTSILPPDITIDCGHEGEIILTGVSSDDAVAVLEDQVIHGKQVGLVTIDVTATLPDGFDKDFTITVVVHSTKPMMLPAALTEVDEEAFMNIPAEEIVLPEGMIAIGVRAFAESGLKLITIPVSVTSIAADAFKDCDVSIITSAGSIAEMFAIEHDIPYIYCVP